MAGFSPIFGIDPKILILGSMPSRVSLKEGQYYAHSRNAFWWIMSELFGFDPSIEYSLRSSILVQSGVAIWDVLYDCERPGSLDAAIVKKSEVPNDFITFFNRNPSLSCVVFNGAAAETLFGRYNKCLIDDINESKPYFEWHRCPSTSPAYASMSKHDKLKAWRKAVT